MFIMHSQIPASQHGVTTRGTNTAWKEVILRAIDWQNIYEYDLKGFFDNVTNVHSSITLDKGILDWAREVSETTNVNIQRVLYENLSSGIASWKLKLDRETFKSNLSTVSTDPLVWYIMCINESLPSWQAKATSEQLESDSVRAKAEYFDNTVVSGIDDFLSVLEEFEEPTAKPDWDRERLTGVPQGGPHSPLISMCTKAVTSTSKSLTNHIEYVDDGITDVMVEGLPEAGCI